ncbi:acyltransferase [Staphylococcus borealis]|uniref:acyltransferase n=1 Tax=Staphylococcus borealis TaxID=2742203 RepID=UPI002A83A283|nr:acyltransferase [Staphylococcus borealis]MDY4022566.1 acyltransferase [Staphylococcus borealis]
MRRLTKDGHHKINPLWRIYRFVRFPRVLGNTMIIEICRFIPNLSWKRWIYIHLLNMSIGHHTAIAYKVMPDLFYPQLITIGNNTVIGYNTTILTHEVLVDEYRYGPVRIGNQTLIGANSTILPGVNIGNHVVVKAGTIVSKDIPDDAVAYGNPMHIHYK